MLLEAMEGNQNMMILKAWEYANTRKGYWRISNIHILARTLSNKYLKEQGFITLTEKYLSLGNSY